MIRDDEEYITLKQTAEILGVGGSRVADLIRENRLRPKTLNRKKRYFIKKIDLENFIVFRREKTLLLKQLAQKNELLLAEYRTLYNKERDKTNLKIESLKKKYPC